MSRDHPAPPDRLPRLLLVAMNYAPELSGTAPYTAAWAEHLAGSADVVVLAGVPHYPQWRIHDGYGSWREQRIERGVTVRRLRHHVPTAVTPLHRVAHEASFGARVLTERLPRPDAVLAVSPSLFGSAAAARLARRWGVPFGLVVQDLYGVGLRELGHAPGPATRALSGLEAGVVRGADSVLTISAGFRTALVDACGADAARIDVVGNWSLMPASGPARSAVRGRHGWQEEFIALHAGNMGAKQQLENVVAAARLADARGVPVRFVLLGGGNQWAELQHRAAGIARIEFIPSASPRVYSGLLAAADVLLVNEAPGVAEMSLPSKLTSYFAAGLPVIAATGPGGATADILRRSGGGTRVEPGDPAALLNAVLAMRANPAAAADFANRGARYGGTHHDVDTAMRGYDGWVDALLAPTGLVRRPRRGVGERRSHATDAADDHDQRHGSGHDGSVRAASA